MERRLDELERRFEQRAKVPSDIEARRHLAAGRAIPFRERDTPPGHVLRMHPDGRVELVEVKLPQPKARQAAERKAAP